MISATEDTVVPPRNTRRLHAALGEPALVWFEANHYTMALKLLDVLKAGDEHLEGLFR
jgi:hypothetical protein